MFERIKNFFKKVAVDEKTATPEHNTLITPEHNILKRLTVSDKVFADCLDSSEKTITSVIAVNLEDKTISIRTPQNFVPDTEEIEIFSYNNTPIKFKTKVLAVRNGYLVLEVPLYVEDAQKRKHYRVNVRNERIEAQLIVVGKGKFEAVPVDLSIGGTKLEIRGRLDVSRNALITLCLQLGDDPLMPISMFVADTSIDKNTSTIRGSFYNIGNEIERKINKYILDVQRKNKK